MTYLAASVILRKSGGITLPENIHTLPVYYGEQEFSISLGETFSVEGRFYRLKEFRKYSSTVTHVLCDIMNPWYVDDVPDAWTNPVEVRLESLIQAAWTAKFVPKEVTRNETDSVFARHCKSTPPMHTA